MMHAIRRSALALTVVLAAGCADDPSDVTASDLYGLWGSVSMVYTSQADPTFSVDVVGTEGVTYSLQLISGGTYEAHLSGPGLPATVETGTFLVQNQQLLLFPEDGPDRTLGIDFNQSLLTLREEDALWDFDDDGTSEPAELEMVLDRF